MTRRVVAVFGFAVGLCVALSPVGGAQGRSSESRAAPAPAALFRALLAAPIPDSRLPAGFSGATVSRGALSANSKRHHAIGLVNIEVTPNAAIIYTVFPTRADGLAAWKEAKPAAGSKVTSERRPVGFPEPALLRNGTGTARNTSGKTITIGVTVVGFLVDTVGVAAGTISTTSTTHGDVQGALKLAKAALAHLRRLGRPVPCSGPGNVIVGTTADDNLVGTDGVDTICGGGGDDTIRGLGGADVLRGDAGNDVLRGGGGDDVLRGGAGKDKLVGDDGDDRLFGDAGDDELDAHWSGGAHHGLDEADRVSGGPGYDHAIVTASADLPPVGVEVLTTCGQIAAGAGTPDCRTVTLGG